MVWMEKPGKVEEALCPSVIAFRVQQLLIESSLSNTEPGRSSTGCQDEQDLAFVLKELLV